MKARLLAATTALLVVSCRRPEAPTRAAPTTAASLPPPLTAAASVPPPPTTAASVPVPAAPASAAAEPAASDPVVMELRKAMPETSVSLTASGRVTRVIASPFEEEERATGRVSPASVEALHQALRAGRLCELAPKQRESAPSYTVDARFPDVTCVIELPDPRWEKGPVAKKIIDAARRIEAEAFPGR